MKSQAAKTFEFHPRLKLFTHALIACGLVGLALAFIRDPQMAWTNILINGYYFGVLGAFGTLFAAMTYLCGARWSEAIRRIPEAFMAFAPVGGLLILLIVPGLGSLYHWTDPHAAHDPILSLKLGYLNSGFFVVRLVVIVALWTIFALAMRSASAADARCRAKRVRLSAAYIPVFALTFVLSAFDWIMSLEPHWYSTIFGVQLFSGSLVATLAAMTLTLTTLKDMGYLPEVNENHLHDMGKLMFAFVFFWAYIWYSQFLLIWYGNIPEETVYYFTRLSGDWTWLFLANLAVNFIIPFIVLLPRSSKRSTAVLKRVSLFLLVGHWLDIYLLVVPGVTKQNVSIGAEEVLIAVGYAGLLMRVVGSALSRRSLLPETSLYLEESLHYHQ